MAQTRALIISIDAMTGEDLAIAKELPHFSALISRGALATDVESVFPSLTYPCHVSMATGCWPMHTGIMNNETFLPETLNRPWFFYTDQIARPTIFSAAREAGISTGCVMWPCMGKGPIDTLVPEIWGDTPDVPFLEPFCRAGSADFIRDIWPIVGNIPSGFAQPKFDEFVTAITVELIRRKTPELLYSHICQIDNAKHYAGLHSHEVREAIKRTDHLLGEMMDALDFAGVLKQTNIVLCSDHGQIQVDHTAYPNRLLAANGLISLTPGGKIDSWKAQVQSACMSAYLYAVSDEAAQEALDLLTQPDIMRELHIEEIVLREHAVQRFHVDGDFRAVILGNSGTYFHNAMDNGSYALPAIESRIPYLANHGHDPMHGEKPFFLISGKDAAAGKTISGGHRLIDEPVTIAALMGFSLPLADGHLLKGMLNRQCISSQ